MKSKPLAARAATMALLAGLLNPWNAMSQTPPADPNLWLEDVMGDKALAWVRERNAETEAALHATPGYDALKRSLREVLDSKAQIPSVTRRGEWFYNLWRDAEHPRGLWRRTTLAEFRKAQPAWETLIDLDALGKAEGENWVWAGATCQGPSYRRCLVQLSRGGADANVVREFDTASKRFVEGGFVLPEAKTMGLEWISDDRIYVATDFGPGTLTDSGYPRIVKEWKRGQPLAEAKTVFEGRKTDMFAWVQVDHTPGHERVLFGRSPDFYTSEMSLLQDGRLVPLDKPLDAQFVFRGRQLFVELRSDWAVGGQRFARGSLLVTDAAAYLKGERRLTALFTPTATRSLGGFTATRRHVLVNVLDNVASRIEAWSEAGGRWQHREVKAPYPGHLSATALHDPLLKDDPLAEAYLLDASDFLKPDTLQLGEAGTDRLEVLKSRPNFYDSTGMRVEQRFATSKDGTKVPYFVIWPQGAKADGRNPTLLYGYGGFEVAMTPFYSGGVGRAWTTRGGVYVFTNIRGGGEFGPAWHQAAIKANKQKSYDDFIAVAEDLIAHKITQPRHLGIQGGSNGGLLVGAVMVQRPDLFNAVVCQVPLLDMQRYHKLLAGASWMAEYGDPDKAEEWAWISKYSPYQNVKAGVKMPPVIFTTSTRDDRVHPGHARKMAARMREQGHVVRYWENIEGGHGGAADNGQKAEMMSLEYSFLWQQLGGR